MFSNKSGNSINFFSNMFFSVLRDEEYEEEYEEYDNEGNTFWNNLFCMKFWFLYFECFLDTTVPATINRNGQAEVFNNGKYYNNWRLETVFFRTKMWSLYRKTNTT